MQKIYSFLFFLVLTLISTRYFFHQGVPVTHDGNNHLIRFANYKIAVRELQVPPRLAPNLVNGYGYPVFNYNYPLANILSLPFSILNFHYELTFKLLIFTSVFFALLGANSFLRIKKFGKNARIFALTVFALNPYIYTSIIFRGNIGEVMAWSILPWIFYFLEKMRNDSKFLDLNFVYLNLLITSLFLAHNITAFFASLLLVFYIVVTSWKNIFYLKKTALVFVWAFINALWFWLPALLEKNLIILDNVDLSINYYRHFPTLTQLLTWPIHFGYSYFGSVDSMSYGLGALQVILFILAVVFFLQKKSRGNVVFFIALFALFFAQLSASRPLYDLLPLASFIQFPWRLALLFSIVLLPVSALIFGHLHKPLKNILLAVVILQTIQFWQVKPIDYHHKNIIDYDADAGTTSVNQENMPKTFQFAFFESKKEPVFLISGKGEIKISKFYGSFREYSLNLKEKSIIIESTAYFPGWETKVDGQKVNYIDNETIQGRLAYELDAGEYQIKTKFTQNTWPRIIGNSLSFLSLLACLWLWQKVRKNKE